MKNTDRSICLLVGRGNENTKDSFQSLTQGSITAIVKPNDFKPAPTSAPSHWSGQPGEDLFFNGWKLLF